MVSGQEYAESLRLVVDHINGCGDEIAEDYEFEGPEGGNGNGYWVNHGGNYYKVDCLETDNLDYFKLTFPYSLAEDYARRLAIEDGRADIDSLSEEEIELEAARADLDRLAGENPDRYAELHDQLMETISSSIETAYQISTTDNGAVEGFTVSHKIFPASESYSIEDYHQASQRAISTGLPGRRLLQQAFSIREVLSGNYSEEDDESDDSVQSHYIA